MEDGSRSHFGRDDLAKNVRTREIKEARRGRIEEKPSRLTLMQKEIDREGKKKKRQASVLSKATSVEFNLGGNRS